MALKVTLSNPRRVGDLWGYLPCGIQLKNGDILAQTCWGSDRSPTPEEEQEFFSMTGPTTAQDWADYNERCAEKFGPDFVNAYAGIWARSTDGGQTFERTGLPPIIQYVQKENGDVFLLRWYSHKDENGKPLIRSWISHDNCHSFDAPYDIPVDCPPLEDGWLYPHRRIMHVEGDTYYVLIYGFFKGDGMHGRSMIFRTIDDFKTLHYYGTIAAWEPDLPHPKGFNETDITRTADGRLLAVIRNQGLLPLYQSHSSNNGATWTTPKLFPGPGVDPCVRTLENGVVVCTYGRPGVHLACSETNGDSWQVHTPILTTNMRNTHAVGERVAQRDLTCAYTDIFVTGPNKVMIIYTAPEDWNHPNIMAHEFQPWKVQHRKDFKLYAIDATIDKV